MVIFYLEGRMAKSAKTQAPIERELKYGLEREEYETLLSAFSPSSLPTELKTFYFDDSKLSLRGKRFGLRIRLKGDQATLTLKYPAKPEKNEPEAFKVRHEEEASLPLAQALDVIAGDLRILDLKAKPIATLKRSFPAKTLENLVYLGNMRLLRLKAPLENGFEVELDRFWIFDEEFFELELELSEEDSPEKADKAVRMLFKSHDIKPRPLKKSKLARFLEIWEKTTKR